MATLTLARWAVALEPTSLPPSVLKAAQRSLYNYIGCAIGGSNHPTVTKALSALSLFFGPPTSTLLGHSQPTSKPDPQPTKTDAQHAALLNGIASHVHDYDDTHLATIIHPTGPVASALLAYAELHPTPISGLDLLTALTAGIEAACKLGLALWPTHYDVGWHITSTTGSVGAAVAVAKLMNLSVQATAHAIGLAATQATGLREMFGSDTKSFHPGRAAQNGLLAAVLAQRGFTSSTAALEARRGWGNVLVCGSTPRLEEFVGQLGVVWETERNAFKPFPCGIVCHPGMDGGIQLHFELAQKALKVEDVEKVELRVHPLVLELTGKKTPRDGLEAKFSVFHGVAVALLYGKAGPAEYADAVVQDPSVISLRNRISATADESLGADESYEVVVLKDGRRLENHVRHAVGSLEVPMSDEQLRGKFVDQVGPVLGVEGARRASEVAWGVGEVEDVRGWVGRLS
ncbi:hypothetical protein M409DRAFT_22985 [Zasmidium cellare ATCC 36951]|uniref:MmgE/PrpD family protein n=1 Tax=Zasmidium cellare ATCC 36951 TaxID=1080233 RepID=A0A6A6CIF8_ZASCE|nr:uncharacterized protein M409DRAFT_22985 [Zasmidium cellare ATCC 36951]KAF2166935.1 hypothetical protein M409DRAFT_22985 [Zasmidium cellare ATCC 36951]